MRNKITLVILLFINILVWRESKKIPPKLTIVPEPTGKVAVKILSFGDEQMYYRILGLKIQNAGDSFGRFTALKDYNYNKLSKWFYLLDYLDDKSSFIPSVAGYYYSQTQKTEDVRYIVDYLIQRGESNFADNWWWLFQAAYLAESKLKDRALAIRLAYKLQNAPKEAPPWVKFFAIALLAANDEKDKARALTYIITNHIDELSEGDRQLVEYFLKYRLAEKD